MTIGSASFDMVGGETACFGLSSLDAEVTPIKIISNDPEREQADNARQFITILPYSRIDRCIANFWKSSLIPATTARCPRQPIQPEILRGR
jgi:hypothetical protein